MHTINIVIWSQECRSVDVTWGRSKTVYVWMGKDGKVTVNVPAFKGDKLDASAYAEAIQAAVQIADYLEAYIMSAARRLIERMPGFERR